MTNNDVFKKIRVALKLRDDDIVEILTLVDFKISKTELSAFFRREDHPNYVECGDQILRNFLNGLVIHFRGTKENPKDPTAMLNQIKQQQKPKAAPKKFSAPKKPGTAKKKPSYKKNEDVSFVKYKNKKNPEVLQDFFFR